MKNEIYSQCIIIQEPPLKFKNNFHFDKYHHPSSCNVSVLWCIYCKNKKRIIDMGESRPCGINHYQASIHAEEKAIKTFINYKGKNKNYEIYVWRWSKGGKIKTKVCCNRCTKLVQKFNLQNRIFTFDNYGRCPAIINNPPLSLAWLIK